MEYNVEVISPTQRKISVTVPAQGVNAIMDQAVRAYGADLSLDGFRKGKVPAAIIEKRFPREIITRATDTLVNTEIPQILLKEKLRPINRMNFDGQSVSRDTEFSFSFSFEILPEIELPEDLSALSVEVGAPDLKPDEVNELTLRIQRSLAKLEPISEARLPVFGDVVTVDVKGTIDGVDVPGMNVQNYMMKLQEPKEDSKNSEIDTVLMSLKPGEEGEGSMPCPEDHPDPGLRGKDVLFKVKLHAISSEVLPELNDELAKQVGFEDIGQLRKVVLEQAMNSKLKEVKSAGQNKLLASVLDGLDFPLPESLVSLHLNEYLAEARNYLMRQGAPTDSINDSLDRMREEGMEQAKQQAKSQAFLMALAFRENLEVSESDVNRQIMQIAQQTQQDYTKLAEAMYRNGVIDELQERILAGKALEFLYSKAKKIVIGADGKPLAAPEIVKDAPADEKPAKAKKKKAESDASEEAPAAEGE